MDGTPQLGETESLWADYPNIARTMICTVWRGRLSIQMDPVALTTLKRLGADLGGHRTILTWIIAHISKNADAG